MSERKRVAHVIGFSAPPVLHLTDFLQVLLERAWDPYVILSPTAASWVDVQAIGDISGHPVRVQPRRPQDPDPLPRANAVIAAPLTFNSLNKWSAGISDTLALGLLNEALGLDVPLVAALCVKEALQSHPAYAESLKRLAAAGAVVLAPSVVILRAEPDQITIDWARLLPS